MPVYKQTRYRRAFSAAEIDSLAALAGRSGSTLDSTLRKVWSGEELGGAFSAKEKRHRVPAGAYRATILIGVQPAHAAPLLSGSAATSGLAQRVLWLFAEDPRIELPVGHGPAWKWRSPLPPTDGICTETDDDGDPLQSPGRTHIVGMPESVKLEVRLARLRQARGEVDPLDGHAGFTRMKVAAGLALLESRLDTDEADWQLAGLVMPVSGSARAHCGSELAAAGAAKAAASGRMAAVGESAADDERLRQAAGKLARHVWKTHAAGQVACRGRCAKNAMGASGRPVLPEAQAFAVNRGWLAEKGYISTNAGAASAGEQTELVPGSHEPPLASR